MSAPVCTFPACGNPTRDPSGRCHHHSRALLTGTAQRRVPPPPLATWISGIGRVHPTGGYDEIVEERASTSYRRNGVNHRLDGPAKIALWTPGSKVYSEEWYIDGERHRDDGPAVLRHSEFGVTNQEGWFTRGKRHRENGPAETQIDRKGRIISEGWWIDGRLHRLDGPARTLSPDDGPEMQAFYVHDEELLEEEFARLRKALDGGAPLEWALSYARGAES